MFNDLETDFDNVAVRSTEKTTFPCMRCSGTGLYQGTRVHQAKQHCFACKGKGHFLTSPEHRQKARAGAQKRKANKGTANLQAFEANYPSVYVWLTAEGARGEFRASMIDSITKWGSLTEKQLYACQHIMGKMAKSASYREVAAKVDLTPVFEKFGKAMDSGIKRPKLRVEGFVFSVAPPSGKNAGQIYVKEGTDYESKYFGKINVDGEFVKGRDCFESDIAQLKSVSADVLGAAVAYGQKTGNCSCCGRELTKAESIEAGIGPICAERWFS